MSDVFPFHDDFQLTALAYLWRGDKALQKHAHHIDSSWFESALNATLCSILLDYHREFSRSPSEAVIMEEVRRMYPSQKDDDQRKRTALVERMTKLRQADILDVEYFDARIREFVRWCAMKEAIMETFDEFKAGKYDPEMPSRFERALMAGQDDFDTGQNWARTYGTRTWNFVAGEKPRIGTGLTHLDAQIGGGLGVGELGILMGLPKGFKSGMMLNFAYNAIGYREAKNVAYITLELSEDLVGIRFDIRCSHLPKYRLIEDIDSFRATLDKRRRFFVKNRDLYIKYFPPRACNCATIREYLRRMADDHGVKFDLLVVDYLDLMKPEVKKERDYLEAVETCEALRALGDDFGMPVWTAVRATREAVGVSRISMKHMSKAFERVGVADLVMAICQTEEEKADGRLRLATVAARNDSAEKEIQCEVDYERMQVISTGVSDIEYEDATDKVPKKSAREKADSAEKQFSSKKQQLQGSKT